MIFRQTVIRNLPQLQKLDNVPVSSEEMVSIVNLILKMRPKMMLKMILKMMLKLQIGLWTMALLQ